MENKSNKLYNINVKKLLSYIFIFLSIIVLFGCVENSQSIGVDSIEISKKNLYMAEGQTAVISAQVYPFNATNQNYTFESSNDAVVTIEDGFITAKKAGDAVIYVYSEDGGYQDSCNVLVTKASDNLALNEYNNLNMPPKTLKPIYNNDNVSKKNYYDDRKKQSMSNVNSITSKKPANIQHYANNLVNTQGFNSFNSNKKQSLKDFIKTTAINVNNQIQDDIQAGKNVLENIKSELQNSINDLQKEKELLSNSLSTWTQSELINSFNNIQCEMIDMFKNLKQDMLSEISNIEQKVEDGEYQVESKNLNGVTFVTIKNNVNESE